MPTAKKAAVIDELTEKLSRINAAALIEYRGLTVAEIGELRTQLRQRNVELHVAKNTLLRTAAHNNNMSDLDDLFSGPNAVAFIYDDEASGTKALNDYFKTARVGEIKAGILKGGRRLTAEQFTKLADLPNRETLLAQIAGLLQSPLSNLVNLFNAPAQQFAYALAALEEKGGAAGAGITVTAQAPEAAASVAADTSSAPESEGSAATTAPADVVSHAETPSAMALAGDVSRAPESEGSASIVPPAATEGAVAEVPASIVEPAPVAEAPASIAEPAPAASPTTVTEVTVGTVEPATAVTESAAEVAPAATTQVAEVAPVATTQVAEPQAAAAPATESPAEALASDTTRAPESEGSAATTIEASSAGTGAQTPSAMEIAANPAEAPESEGSAGAQP